MVLGRVCEDLYYWTPTSFEDIPHTHHDMLPWLIFSVRLCRAGCSKPSAWQRLVEKAFGKSVTALTTRIVWFCSIWCWLKINIGLTKDFSLDKFFSVASHSKLICRNLFWWHLGSTIKICSSPKRVQSKLVFKAGKTWLTLLLYPHVVLEGLSLFEFDLTENESCKNLLTH